MSEIQDDLEFDCPYCMTMNALQVDKTGGERQVFVTDCETCCKPIKIEINIEPDGYVSLSAAQENE